MKKIMFIIVMGLVLLLPVVVLANPHPYPHFPGCWGIMGENDLNSFAGIVLVSFSVGIVLYSSRR